jgi:hypothetical protein
MPGVPVREIRFLCPSPQLFGTTNTYRRTQGVVRSSAPVGQSRSLTPVGRPQNTSPRDFAQGACHDSSPLTLFRDHLAQPHRAASLLMAACDRQLRGRSRRLVAGLDRTQGMVAYRRLGSLSCGEYPRQSRAERVEPGLFSMRWSVAMAGRSAFSCPCSAPWCSRLRASEC